MPSTTTATKTTSSTVTSPSPTGSGIQTLPTGDRHIPASTRADGSLRKEIKIRPGYRPPEDVEVYKNRTAEAWKTKGSGGVPGADAAVVSQRGPGGGGGGVGDEEKSGGAAAAKNAKRREARKRAKAAGGGEKGPGGGGDGEDEDEADEEAEPNDTNDATSQPSSSKPPTATTASAVKNPDKSAKGDEEAEREKQARALKKKLRQARELAAKKDSGAGLLPEQVAKVIKIQELVRQLAALGFEGEDV